MAHVEFLIESENPTIPKAKLLSAVMAQFQNLKCNGNIQIHFHEGQLSKIFCTQVF